MTQSRQFVESLSRGFRILSIVCESKTPLSLSELAVESELSISTIQRLSYTLRELGLIDRDRDTKRFRIGPKMIMLALMVKQNLELKRLARPYMQETSDGIGEVVGLGALSGNEIILVEIIKIDQLLNINMNTGAIIPPHATATGKSILAFLDELRAEEILRHSQMTRFTPHTITSIPAFLKQVKKVKELGYSLAIDENAQGFSAIAAPVSNSNGEVIAAVTIMVPSARMSKERLQASFSKKVIQCADKISEALGHRKSAA